MPEKFVWWVVVGGLVLKANLVLGLDLGQAKQKEVLMKSQIYDNYSNIVICIGKIVKFDHNKHIILNSAVPNNSICQDNSPRFPPRFPPRFW